MVVAFHISLYREIAFKLICCSLTICLIKIELQSHRIGINEFSVVITKFPAMLSIIRIVCSTVDIAMKRRQRGIWRRIVLIWAIEPFSWIQILPNSEQSINIDRQSKNTASTSCNVAYQWWSQKIGSNAATGTCAICPLISLFSTFPSPVQSYVKH